MKESKIQKVHALVAQNGGWKNIYSHYPALEHCYRQPGKEFPCPKHPSEKKNSTKFSFFRNTASTSAGAFHRDDGALPDGIEVLSWYLNVSKREVLDIIIDLCGGDISKVTRSAVSRVKRQRIQSVEQFVSKEEATRRHNTLKKVWRDATPIKGTLAENYLHHRGILGSPDTWHDLYFHPALSYKEDDKSPWIKLPGMLSIVRNADGKPVTLHRTFLNADGTDKAAVTRKKMLLAQPKPLKGACIMLDKPVNTLLGGLIGISEGIETALSVREATGCPMWIGISDRIMEKMEFASFIQTIVVWADIEASAAGMRAAKHIAEKWQAKGKQVIIKDPSLVLQREKVDWNDVYVELGASAFDFHLPQQERIAS